MGSPITLAHVEPFVNRAPQLHDEMSLLCTDSTP